MLNPIIASALRPCNSEYPNVTQLSETTLSFTDGFNCSFQLSFNRVPRQGHRINAAKAFKLLNPCW